MPTDLNASTKKMLRLTLLALPLAMTCRAVMTIFIVMSVTPAEHLYT